MSKKLIIVADDFGFSEAYNLGVLKAYKDGVVTTLSLMSNMDAAKHAAALAKKEIPKACIVQHTNFVQGRPCSNPKDIPSMVDENGMFYRSSKWRTENPNDKKCVGNVVAAYEDCKRETISQMERFKDLTGKYPIHLEGHSVFTKAVSKAFNEVAKERKIHCMTMPEAEIDTMYPAHELSMSCPGYMDILNRGCRPEDFFTDAFGILNSDYDINILHFHPGYLDAYLLDNTSLKAPRCRDLETLCNPKVRKWIKDNNIELVDFSAVYK